MASILGPGRILSDPVDLVSYSCDSGLHSLLNPQLPLAVVLPRSTQEVSETMRFCSKHKLPVTPRGAASGQAGGCVASPDGIVIDLSAMNRVREIDAPNRQAWVESGISYAALNEQLAPYNLYLPTDPSSGRACTLGGMAANNSSGPHSLKYGPTSHYILGLEVALPSGEVVITGGRRSKVLKSSSGLNLTQLFVGSGGTLGVITAVRLRLIHRPRARTAVLAAFSRMDDGWKLVQQIWKEGIAPAAMEFEYLAPGTTAAAAKFRPSFHLPNAELVLIIDMDGNEGSVRYELETVLALARPLAQRLEQADDPRGVAELWEMLDSVEGASSQVRPGASRIPGGEDISVPLTRMSEALKGIRAIAERNGIGVVIFGHAGEGNIHSGLLLNPKDPREVSGAITTMREIHELALRLGGSLTGEHGIGTSRVEYVESEHGPAYQLMSKVKQILDPNNIMNPGKLFKSPGSQATGIKAQV